MTQAQNRHSAKPYRSPLASPRPQPSGSRSQRSFTRATAQKRPPLIFWGGIWAIVFLISITALANLLNPAASKAPQLAQAKVQAPVTPSGQGRSPVWLLGAIVLSCGASSFLLTRRIGSASISSRQRSKQRVGRKPVPTFHPNPSGPLPVKPPPPRPVPPPQAVPVAIVPSEQAHPLDQGEVSLADLLDLRKQSPELWGYRRQRH